MSRFRFNPVLNFPKRKRGLSLRVTNNGDGTATWRITGSYTHTDLGGIDINWSDDPEQLVEGGTYTTENYLDSTTRTGVIEINDPTTPLYFRFMPYNTEPAYIEDDFSNIVGPITITNDADAVAWNDRITAASGAGDLADLQDYVATTKADGTWSKHILMLHGWNVANANLVRSNGATVATYQGTPAHSGNTLMTNGSSSALRTGLIPNDTGWFGQFFYKTSTTASSSGVDFGAANTGVVTLINVNFIGSFQADYGGNQTTQRQSGTGQILPGLYACWTPDGATARFSRTTSSGTTVLSSAGISGSQPKPTTELTLGGFNINGNISNFCTGSYNCSGVLTASMTSTERDDLIAAIITLLLARGWIT